MNKYIIWDFDGTLGYRSGMWAGALVEAARQVDPTGRVNEDDLRPHLKQGFPWHTPEVNHTEIVGRDEWWDALDSVSEAAFRLGGGYDAPSAQRMTALVRVIYPRPGSWQLYPDALSALQDLQRRNWRQLMLSNHVPELGDILRSLGIDRYFEHILSSARTGYEKPNRLAFQLAVQEIGPASNVCIIGDSYVADIEGARQVGIRGILVRNHDQRAEYFSESLFTVPAILDKIIS
jgi:putative hydrolase of the HAD superfamily